LRNRIYVDTSAYVKTYLKEPGSDNVEAIFNLARQSTKIRIYMSYWVINEAIAVIYRRYNHKPQTERDVLISTILNLVADAKSNIIVVSINQNSIKETIGYISKYHLRAGDALHLCIANKFRCNYFITADHDFMSLGLSNLQVLDIQSHKDIDHLLNSLE
jgi:predicted nucleic acid-binding protein